MHKRPAKTHQTSRAQTVSHRPSLQPPTPRSSTEDPEVPGPKNIVEVDFSELADGTLLEMIENPNDARKSLLAVSKNGQVRCVESLEVGDQVFVPVPRDSAILRHLQLANGIESLESARSLFEEIMWFLQHVVELTPLQLFMLSGFIMATWLIEKLPFAPYAAFVGPPESGKTTALRALNLLCRRSLLTSDITSSALHAICERMTPTVLIDETATVDNRRQLFHVLRTGTSQDFVAVRKNNTFKLYGARAVSWLELPEDAALNSRCLIISMKSCTRTRLLPLNDPQLLRVAKMLQRKLLRFRLENFQTLTLPRIAGEERVQPRTRDLFRALALPFGEEKMICEAFLLFLKEQESLRELLSVYQTAVLDSLYEFIHAYPEQNQIRISALKEHVNENLLRRGESGNLSEKRVGNLLTSLHLTDRPRANSGYILRIDRNTREEIHLMAWKYLKSERHSPHMSKQCQLCEALSQDPASASPTESVQPSAGTEAKNGSERCALSEHRNRRARRKPARSGLARPRISRPKKRASPKRRRYFIGRKAPKDLF